MKWDAMMIRQTIQVTQPEAYQEHVQKFTGQIGLIPPVSRDIIPVGI